MNFNRLLSLAVAGALLAARCSATIVICGTDANGNRECWTLVGPTWTCENRPLPECYDIPPDPAIPQSGGGVLHGSHPSLDSSGILGSTGAITFVGRADGQNFAVRPNAEQPLLIEVAALPNALDLIALGPVITGMQFVGEPISLPPFVGEFDAGEVTSGDFAMIFALLNPVTLEVEQFRTEPVSFGELEFVVLGPACAGDLNGDGALDLTDLAVLLSNFGVGGAGYAGGDIDLDGLVNLSDLAMLLGGFGSSCR